MSGARSIPAPRRAAAGTSARPSWRTRPWWPRAKRIVTGTFFAVVAWLVVDYARTIDWNDVWGALVGLPRTALAAALALVACSYLLYSTYDLLGRTITRHRLGTGTTMGVTLVCYAFNLNLGSLVGSVALRYRLYSRLGLDNDTITRVIGFSMLTNWAGYLVIAGAAFCFGSVDLPPNWEIDGGGLRVLGAVLMVAGLAYPVVCAAAGERVWKVRGHEFATPSWRMALLQLAMSVANWALMGGVLWVLMQARVGYLHVLAVLLVAAVAGLLTHVPAGLGVIEAVFLALLGHQVGQGRLLGALLAYRALYYLLPLVVACVFYLVTEVRAKRLRRTARES